MGRSGRDQKSGLAFDNEVFAAGVPRNDERQAGGHRFLLDQRPSFDDPLTHPGRAVAPRGGVILLAMLTLVLTILQLLRR